MAGAALLTLGAYLVLRHTGLLRYTALFPTAEEGMGYGMLFVIGLLTSVHCIAMCGGINLSQCMGACPRAGASPLGPGLRYNLGRVVSYTAVGALVGALGSVFSFSGLAKGLIQLLAGVFMVLMGLSMLGLAPGLRRLLPALPGGLSDRVQAVGGGRGPLLVGLLNGLMPCGPLQAMQLYALSTGSPLRGALSMLLFSLGTVPLMLGLSVFSTVMSRRLTKHMMAAGAVLVVVLGISMFQNGLALSGFSPAPAAADREPAAVSRDGVQVINTRLAPYGYEAITVEAGIPVQWTITAETGTVNGCNGRLVIPAYGIEKRLEVGENLIEFTPAEGGVFSYSCWMGMIRSTITVTQGGELPEGAGEETQVEQGISLPRTVSYALPTDSLAVARVENGVQEVAVTLENGRFSPSVVVVQSGLETQWVIDNKAGSRYGFIVFPTYFMEMELVKGKNSVGVTPRADFDFWVDSGDFAGYVVAVEDLESLDERALLEQLEGTTLFYSAYGGDTGVGMACCQ